MATDKEKLREILFALSSEDEKSEYLRKEKLDDVDRTTKEIKEKLNSNSSNEAVISELKSLSKQMSRIRIPAVDHTPVVEAIREMAEKISSSQKPQDFSGPLNDFAAEIAKTGSSAKSTEELIKTLKWNSTMGIKNRSGSPISPAVSPFAISDYDTINLSSYDANGNPGTVVYKQGNQQIASLTLSYDGSGNLTSVIRTA